MQVLACEECTILNLYFSSDIKWPLSEPHLKVAESVLSRNRNVYVEQSKGDRSSNANS